MKKMLKPSVKKEATTSLEEKLMELARLRSIKAEIEKKIEELSHAVLPELKALGGRFESERLAAMIVQTPRPSYSAVLDLFVKLHPEYQPELQRLVDENTRLSEWVKITPKLAL